MRYGIFGGAFNPPHIEHLKIIDNAYKELNLDKIILIPTNNAPHKRTNTDFMCRVEMLKLFLGERKYVEIDDIENQSQNKHYTYDLIDYLDEKYPNYIYIIGGDSLINFEKWYKWQQLLQRLSIAVVIRGDNAQFTREKARYFINNYGANITILNFTGKDDSSGMIRAMLNLGQYDKCRTYLTDEVIDYIKLNELYTDYREFLPSLKRDLSEERYKHSLSTVIEAVRINSYLGLDFDKVFIAALLHDCGKYAFDVPIKYDVPSDSIGTPVLHQFLGAQVAKYEYGIEDEEILNAIKYHTTSCVNNTLLGKLIYVADAIEPTREYEGIDELRKLAEQDFEECYKRTFLTSYRFVVESNRPIYPLSKLEYEHIKELEK